MKKNFTFVLGIIFSTIFTLHCHAQATVTLPTSKAQTDDIISARRQITDVPTVYLWMFDAEDNAKGNPIENKNDALGNKLADKKDYYYKIRGKNAAAGDYNMTISDNTITNADEAYINPISSLSDESGAKLEQYNLARIKIVDQFKTLKERDELTTIRGRGNSTWNSQKKPFRLKFPNKTKLLCDGYGNNSYAIENSTREYADAKSWTLLANATDKSLIQNALTREVSMLVGGMPYYPAYKFVDLVLNDVYIGTYQISDQNQVDPGRVNIDETTGWFMEFVQDKGAFIEAPYVVINNGSYAANIKNPEVPNDDSNDASLIPIQEYLNNVYNLCNAYNKDFSETSGLWKYVDMESLVDYVISNEITGNYDGGISNYAYKNGENDKLHFGPLWDFDLAYGNYEYATELTNNFIFNKGKNSDWIAPLVSMKNIIANSPEFCLRFNEKWAEVYDNGKLIETMKNKVDELSSSFKNSRILNYTPVDEGGAGWGIGTKLVNGIDSKTYTSYDESISFLKNFIETRIDSLNTKIQKLKPTASDYTLDASSYHQGNDNYFYNQENKLLNIKISNRTFQKDIWNTICLPFSLTEERLKETFGDNVQLYEYSEITDNTMTFSPAPDTKLLAGKPYLLKFSNNNITNPSFSNVVFSASKPLTIYYPENNGYGFAGTILTTSLSTDGTNLFLKADGKLYKPTVSGNKIGGLRAYFIVPSNAANISIAGIDETIDGIQGLEASTIVKNSKIYNLNGQYVGNMTDALPKGIYVSNGQKFVVD